MCAINLNEQIRYEVTLNKNFHILLGFILLSILLILSQKYLITNLNNLSFCVHYRLFGIKCPGCGFTRATYNLFHLNFKQAISLNPTVIFVFPIIALEIFYFFKKIDAIKKIKYFTYALFVIALFFIYLIRIFYH